MIAAVDAAHWWGPAGWVYRNCAGNVAASAIWGPIGLIAGATWAKTRVIRPMHRRMDAHAQSLADLHAKQDQLHAHLGVGRKP